MKYRHRVLVMLSVLSVITYLDRVCISVAGPRMQEDLGISPQAWGWVVGVFAVAYGVFEIPSGYLGDRHGPRKVLTRIVVWWSVFTCLTGAVSNYRLLLLTRFLFGAGEAGAYPNMSASISRWFRRDERGKAWGVIWMASQLGAALTPVLVVPIQARFGWRASFFVFGLLGFAWSLVWLKWYRGEPAGKREFAVSGGRHRPPWKAMIRSRNLHRVMFVAFAYCYAMYFFLSWLHTYLENGRGFTERELTFSTFPFLLGAVANGLGGVGADALSRRFGLKWGRRAAGACGLSVAAIAIGATFLVSGKFLLLAMLALAYAGITFQQPAVWAVCLDIGGESAGAVSGAMNTAAQAGSFLLSIVYGYLAGVTGSLQVPLATVVAMLVFGAAMWLGVDPARKFNEPGQLQGR